MKKRTLSQLSIIALIAVGIIGCNPLKKMSKYEQDIKYTVTPDPLEMHGDSVTVSITGKIPPKFFHKLATVTATPVLKNAEGEVVKEFKETKLIGEAVDGDGQKIPFEAGGSFSYNDKIAYDPSMENVTLNVKAVAGFKTKTKEFESRKVADGTKTTPLWVQKDARPILGKDNFVKVIPRTSEAQINYAIQSSQVQPKELQDDDIKALRAFVKDGVAKGFEFKIATVSAYASPDGEMALNDNLANDRAKTGGSALKTILKNQKSKAADKEGFVQEIGKGEDWDGFKTAMASSDIADKELILRVLSMYPDGEKREQEIKNMAATYVELADKILPGLRRAQIVVKADEKARTDEEITKLLKSDPTQLSVEEVLYGATLTQDLNEKMRIYGIAKSQFPKDWRGANNVGYIYVLQNNMSAAKGEFDAAAAAGGTNIVKNNQGVVALFEGNTAAADDAFKAASGAGPEVNYNMGIIAVKKGDYSTAVSKFGSETTLNAGLAKMLNGDNEGAVKAIDASADKDSAAGLYLKAVAAARGGNADGAVSNLKNAIAKDGGLKKKAANDAEFVKLRENEAFKSAIQ
ncbi:MAG: hypothetical protein KDC83_12975 [Flavobacteriales bacterium]|nr:hypothetical protein [Flavobacteriales bacterium]